MLYTTPAIAAVIGNCRKQRRGRERCAVIAHEGMQGHLFHPRTPPDTMCYFVKRLQHCTQVEQPGTSSSWLLMKT